MGELIYKGTWSGLGEMYDLKVGAGEQEYTTIIWKKTECIFEKIKATWNKFHYQPPSYDSVSNAERKDPSVLSFLRGRL